MMFSPVMLLAEGAWASPETWAAVLSLTAMEIVLGIDNLMFIAIVVDRLPKDQQKLAYRLGLGGALVTRLLLLFTISWILRLSEPLFTLLGEPLSVRHLVLFAGGLFLVAKGATEMFHITEGHEDGGIERKRDKPAAGMAAAVTQVMLLDIVFSIDSVVTAVGMVEEVTFMVIAILAAIVVMLVFAQRIGDFVNRHPSLKVLALAFLVLIGVLLVAEGLNQHFDKRYVYFSMAFALVIELINMRRLNKARASRKAMDAV